MAHAHADSEISLAEETSAIAVQADVSLQQCLSLKSVTLPGFCQGSTNFGGTKNDVTMAVTYKADVH